MTTPHLPRISDYPFSTAQRWPERMAMKFSGRCWSYAELVSQVDRCAKALLALGVAPGDRVAMLTSPRPEFLIVFLATVRIGAIWTGLNPRYTMRERAVILANATPTVLFSVAQPAGSTHPGLEQGRIIAIDETDNSSGTLPYEEFADLADQVSNASYRAAQHVVMPDDPAVIVYTSGTTGVPKGVVISHQALVLGNRARHQRWPSQIPRIVANLPVNHIGGLGDIVCFALVGAGTIYFMESFDAEVTLKMVQREKINLWLQVPTMYRRVSELSRFKDATVPALEWLIWSGAPMPPELLRKLARLDTNIATAYGLTESCGSLTGTGALNPAHTPSTIVGFPHPGCEIRIADDAGRSVESGHSGEIQARSPWMMSGYFDLPEASTAAFTADGWLRTGDIGTLHADGSLHLVGRATEMFITGGYNVYPREIEAVLEQHPAVAMAVVIAVPDPVFQESATAFIQLADEVSPQPRSAASIDFSAWCRQQLAGYKVPRHFIITTDFPLLPNGKIDRRALGAGRHRPTVGQPMP
ncbi:MAG: class I adenylate-forming enzyme family protein [Arenicellales bacterium]|nr:class I adenylate-forming enzyme family protein [Arenicellales bacterium]